VLTVVAVLNLKEKGDIYMDTILTISAAVISVVVWLVRLESKANSATTKSNDNAKEIETMRAELTASKEQYNEMKTEIAVMGANVTTVKEQTKTIIDLFNAHVIKPKNV